MTGKQLERWRKKRGLSRRAMGERFGLGQVTVWRYERGVSPIPRSFALAVEHTPEGGHS